MGGGGIPTTIQRLGYCRVSENVGRPEPRRLLDDLDLIGFEQFAGHVTSELLRAEREGKGAINAQVAIGNFSADAIADVIMHGSQITPKDQLSIENADFDGAAIGWKHDDSAGLVFLAIDLDRVAECNSIGRAFRNFDIVVNPGVLDVVEFGAFIRCDVTREDLAIGEGEAIGKISSVLFRVDRDGLELGGLVQLGGFGGDLGHGGRRLGIADVPGRVCHSWKYAEEA